MKNYLSILFVLLACSITGCEPRPTWQYAMEDYTCTPEQHAKVVAETEKARDLGVNKALSTHYLYSAAIMRNCTPKKP